MYVIITNDNNRLDNDRLDDNYIMINTLVFIY